MAVELLKVPIRPEAPAPPDVVREPQQFGTAFAVSCSPFDEWLASRGLTAADLHTNYLPIGPLVEAPPAGCGGQFELAAPGFGTPWLTHLDY